jgi:hypothetical protein
VIWRPTRWGSSLGGSPVPGRRRRRS